MAIDMDFERKFQMNNRPSSPEGTNFVVRFARSIFCKHEFRFKRNIYGDEIIQCGWKRSIWECHKCGKQTYGTQLQKEETNE